MHRREFLAAMAGAALPAVQPSILVHEHVLVDFRGPAAAPGGFDPDEVIRIARPHLERIAQLGCRRFLDCTPHFVGRNPRLLRSLAAATGLDIWTNTGLYAARNRQLLPDYASAESAEQLARRWIEEARRGVDGIKPRFIKIGVNRAPLHELDRKIVQAAALCSKETGLTIASHTGDGAAALEQLEILTAAKATLSKFVWVHAQSEKDHAVHEKTARAGAWVEFDGISPRSLDWHEECLRFMSSKGLLGRTLISQDAGFYRAGEPGGGDFRPYSTIYEEFLPRLDSAWHRLLMLDNPVRAFGGGAPR
jgi:phosphotriesterase-related protein